MRLEELSSLYDEKDNSILESKIETLLRDEIKLLLFYDGEEIEDKTNKEVLQYVKKYLKEDRRAMERISKAFINASRNLFIDYQKHLNGNVDLLDYISGEWAIQQSNNPNKEIVESISENATWTKSHTAKMVGASRPTIDKWIKDNNDSFKTSKKGIWVKSFLEWLMNNNPKHFEKYKANLKQS